MENGNLLFLWELSLLILTDILIMLLGMAIVKVSNDTVCNNNIDLS